MFFLLIGFLVLGPQVVFSAFFKLGLTQVDQCERFTINFKGDLNRTSPPSSLTILPFDSVPISIPVPSNALSFTGLDINFLPLKENTSFIVSLDNAENESLSLASDVTRVSASQNASCIPSAPVDTTPSPYTIVGAVRQCEDFTVRYNTTNPPTIRRFFPNGFSFPLMMTSNSNDGATYTMAAGRGQRIVLLFDDGEGSRRTSSLLSVDGDSSSSNKCLQFFGNFTSGQSAQQPAKVAKVSTGVIIGLSVGGGIIVLVALAMTMFVLRECKRRRRLMAASPFYNPPSQPSQGRDMVEKQRESLPLPPLPTPATITYPEGYVKDPPYVSERYSPTISDYPRTSISWEIVDGETQPKHRSSHSTRLASMDIEKMLDIAAEPERDSRLPTSPGSPPVQYTSSQPVDSSPTLPNPRYRSRPDVPQNPSFFGASSSYAEMHGFGGDAGSVPFFESPRTMSDLHSPGSPGFIFQRPQNAHLPRSPLSSGYPSGVLEDRSQVRNSVPFPRAPGLGGSSGGNYAGDNQV
ncbi:hypothetical protein L218DRAFT_965276 [Marasmius fiardii PR-910]|nr:hypothetical protein L218DRAFT_965276 [Marasmius fiardii PR-910]